MMCGAFLASPFLQQNIESVRDKKCIWYNADGLSCHTGKIKEKGLQKAKSKKLYTLINKESCQYWDDKCDQYYGMVKVLMVCSKARKTEALDQKRQC